MDNSDSQMDDRERRVLERARDNAALMDQYQASRESIRRGEPSIPGAQVAAEAEARQRALKERRAGE
jgi:hypothetical protein